MRAASIKQARRIVASAMIPLILSIAFLCLVIWWLSRRPALHCGECRHEIGSNPDCEGCVNWGAYP